MNKAFLTDSEVVKVEHIFTFNIDDKWDKPIKRAVDSILTISWQWAKTSQIIGCGIAAYLVLLGASKVISSLKGDNSSSHKSSSDSKSRSSKKSSSSSSKGTLNGSTSNTNGSNGGSSSSHSRSGSTRQQKESSKSKSS